MTSYDLHHSLQDLLEDLSAQRFLINSYLGNTSEAQLRREGIHPVYGRFTMTQWADFVLLHEAHHLFNIFMLTAQLRKKFQH